MWALFFLLFTPFLGYAARARKLFQSDFVYIVVVAVVIFFAGLII